MSTETSVTQTQPQVTLVSSLLALRSQVQPTSSVDVLTKISNLRGILDARTLSSARNGGDWRRGSATEGRGEGRGGAGAGAGAGDSRWRGSRQGGSKGNSILTGANLLPVSSLRQGNAPISNIPQKTTIYTGPPIGRYQSRFKTSTEAIEEKILNRIIQLKLNKFGPTTYSDIRDFLFQILGQETVATEEDGTVKAEENQVAEFVKDFMLMVFKKAASEQIYCPLYAKLLSEIGSKHSVIFEEMNRLYTNYMEIFEEADVNVHAEGKEAFEKKVAEKKYRQGYSQFIAELTTLEVLSVESLAKTFHTLFKQIDKHSRQDEKKPLVDEYVDCVLRMSRITKEKHSPFFRNIRSKIYEENKETLDTLITVKDGTFVSLTPKSRFLLMDIQDILKV